jgi:hypothetical protein
MNIWYKIVVLCGVMFSVIATEFKVRGLKPGKGHKIRSTPSFGGEVKPSAPCRTILRLVKDPCGEWQRYYVC